MLPGGGTNCWQATPAQPSWHLPLYGGATLISTEVRHVSPYKPMQTSQCQDSGRPAKTRVLLLELTMHNNVVYIYMYL